MFGAEFFENAMLVFTKFSQDEKSIRERKKGKKISEECAIKEYTQHFLEEFDYTPDREQFCFIDNGIDSDPDADEYEKEMYDKSFSEIRTFANGNQPFFCRDIKVILKEKDALVKKIIENEAIKTKERAEYIAAEETKHELTRVKFQEELDQLKEESKVKEDLLKEMKEREAAWERERAAARERER